MRAILIRERAPRGPVAAQIDCVEDWEEPSAPGRGELLVHTECSALNHMDLWVGMGIPGVEIRYPHVSGCDACGIVTQVGDEVDERWVGQRVVHNAALRILSPPFPDAKSDARSAPRLELLGEHRPGTHRERYLIDAANAVVVGDADPAEAAAFGLTTLTAYSMMFRKGDLRPGQSVLITGIGGGVATSALALARWYGCEIFVTSRHRAKLDRAFELGAHHLILDEGEDWSPQVRTLSAKRGVDMVVDTVGQATHPSCLKSLARGGAYVTAGATSGPRAETDLARIFWNQLRVLGSTMGSNDELREIVALFRAGHLRPVIDTVFPWDQARQAWERLESAEQMGKIVLRWS